MRAKNNPSYDANYNYLLGLDIMIKYIYYKFKVIELIYIILGSYKRNIIYYIYLEIMTRMGTLTKDKLIYTNL